MQKYEENKVKYENNIILHLKELIDQKYFIKISVCY